jgi:hypothetical protein
MNEHSRFFSSLCGCARVRGIHFRADGDDAWLCCGLFTPRPRAVINALRVCNNAK